MATEPAQPLIAQDAGALRRPGRALIGWMPIDMGAIVLAGGDQGGQLRPDLRGRVDDARQKVAARSPGADQAEIVNDSHPILERIINRLKDQQNTASFWAEGWSVAIVDLRSVCSLQQSVASEQANARVADIDPNDMNSISEVTLPPASLTNLPAQFDSARGAWIVSAANPNLRITGNFGGEIQPGTIGFGFTVGILPSFLQVARHHGRWVLRDGYHRAYGLLARGVSHAPAFVRDYGVGDLGTAQGLFTTDVYLGERPPLLIDFLNNEVAADVEVPVVQKMIVIHGLELSPLA
jgi:hypothetical protein